MTFMWIHPSSQSTSGCIRDPISRPWQALTDRATSRAPLRSTLADRSHALRSARPRGRGRSWWCGRRRPGHVREVEEIQQIGLSRVAVGQVRAGVDEAVLHELDDGGVIHRDMGDVVLPGAGGDKEIRQAETELRGEAF